MHKVLLRPVLDLAALCFFFFAEEFVGVAVASGKDSLLHQKDLLYPSHREKTFSIY